MVTVVPTSVVENIFSPACASHHLASSN